jgi:ribonuclease HII
VPGRRTEEACDRFQFETRLAALGCRSIAGVDEAGRGPLAGPVVAGAVILPRSWITTGSLPTELEGLNDSKQLTPVQRERFYAFLVSHAEVLRGVSAVDASQIDSINILQATHRAMHEALAQLRPAPDHILVDGSPVPSLAFPQSALIRGDARSYSIAAASVLAKVTRDRLMTAFHLEYPDYGFDDHKGYGTPRHLAALARFGPCPIHRRSFAPVRWVQTKLL